MKKKQIPIEDWMGGITANYYDKAVVESLTKPLPFSLGIIGYRKVRVPRYLEIDIPVVNRHYDSEYGEYEGLLITTKRIRLFMIGTKIEEVPIYKKCPATITFRRYGKPLTVKDVHKAVNKLKRKLSEG